MWEELDELDKKINALSQRVRRAVTPVPASAREMMTQLALEIRVPSHTFEDRGATFYNGSGETIVLQRLSVGVTSQSAAQAAAGQRTTLGRLAWGWAASSVFFDFQWNYLISSRQSAYSRQFVSSTVFNGTERSQMFDLYEGLVLKPADSLELKIRPLTFPLETNVPTTSYFVNFLALGHRSPL